MENFCNFKVVDYGGITFPKGFKAAGVNAKIKKNSTKKDVALIYSEELCSAAGTFTKNKVAAAPVIVSKENINNGYLQAIVANSGIANACTGQKGIDNAKEMASIAAKLLNIKEEDVLVASTGVIGVDLDMERINYGINEAFKNLSYEGGHDAECAIMTTDTVPKEFAIEFEIGGRTVRIGAMAKGSGMIHPNMATMLNFITTDVCIDSRLLLKALQSIVEDTFNMVSVDGDTSTNDMAVILANGLSGNKLIDSENEDYEIFYSALYYVLENIAIKMAKDGEGATKLITAKISNAPTKKAARCAAKAIIMSSLVKTAIYGEDANWGRILCAVGYSGIDFDTQSVDIFLRSKKGSIMVAQKGRGILFDEEIAKQILKEDEIFIDVDLNFGEFSAKAWGCDLTYDYVKINADYRS